MSAMSGSTNSRRSRGRWASRAAATLVAVVIVTALPLGRAVPARADQARQRQLWVLNALRVPAAWRVTRGSGVVVAVIDSGVDPSVSDLTGSVLTGPDYTGVPTPSSNPNWGAHGTWMASLIAGHGHGPGARDGILGVAPRAKILSVRVITDRTDPGYRKYLAQAGWRGQRELADGIKYAVRHGARVISLSLGYDASSLTVRSALQYALNHNVVVVASSGNAGTSHSAQTHSAAPYSFPADYPGVIGVAAVTQSGQPAYFSSGNLSVAVAAPGVDVPAQGRGSKYWVVSGTSPACALTAGVAALVKARYPKLTAAQVRSAITRSTSNRPRGGYNDHVGFGSVDAAAALRIAGRLAGQVPGGRTRAGKAAAAGNFGHGTVGVPAFPVRARGRQKLLEFLGVGVGCLVLVIIALALLIGGRRKKRIATQAGKARAPGRPGQAWPPGGPGQAWPPGRPGQSWPPGPAGQAWPPGPAGQSWPPGPAGQSWAPWQQQMRPGLPGVGGDIAGRPITGGGMAAGAIAGGPAAGGSAAGGGPADSADAGGASGSELDVRYPTQIYPAQPPGQGPPAPGQPLQGLPVPGLPVPGLPVPGLPVPGLPVQGLPVQGYLGQPGQGLPVQGYLGQPEQPEPGQGAQPQSGQPTHPGEPGQSVEPPLYGQPAQPGEPPLSGQPAFGTGQYRQPALSDYGFSSEGYPGPGYSGAGQIGPGHQQPAPWAGYPGQTAPPPVQQGQEAQAPAPAPAPSPAFPPAPTPAAAGDSSQDDWLFDDGPNQPAEPALPAGWPPDQKTSADPHADYRQSVAHEPSAPPLPPEPNASKWAEDPLTSPRFSRENLLRDDSRWQAFRSDWLTRGQDATRQTTPEPRRWFGAEEAAEPAAVQPPAVADSAQTEQAASQPSQPSEPVMRSVWEPLARNRSAPAAPAPATANPAPTVAAPGIAAPAPAAPAPAAPAPAAWRKGMSQRPDQQTASSSRPPAGCEAGAAEAAANPDGLAVADSVPHEPLSSSLPGRETRPGAEPLPRRQPMTHLAAPLRRDEKSQRGRWPEAGGQEQAEPAQKPPKAGEKLPSVWDTWRPAATVRRAAQAEISESGDDAT
jgi:Subtilase family